MHVPAPALAALLLLGLSGCPSTEEAPPDPSPVLRGTVSGQLTIDPPGIGLIASVPGPGSAGLAGSRHLGVGLPGHAPRVGADATHPALDRLPEAPPRHLPERFRTLQTPPRRAPDRSQSVIPGELLVRRRVRPQGLRTGAIQAMRMPGLEVRLESLPAPSPRVEHLRVRHPDGTELNAEETEALAARLNAHPDYLSAEPNRWVYPQALPNDPYVPLQWHLAAMALPEAWELQTDASDIVVAVLDTGIVRHPDLDGNILPGADLIRDPDVAGDGNGWDDDPTDTHAVRGLATSSHGTAVAGAIGARTHNGRGIAGVTWSVRMVPVRVQGPDGGSLADFMAGVEWAMGERLEGLRRNPNPADVLNLSVAAWGPPSPAYQAIIDSAVAKGAILVIAAGNDNGKTSIQAPCNQDHVICVGASTHDMRRASYSNYGAEVTVMAPAGDFPTDFNGDGYQDTVLTTDHGPAGDVTYQFAAGTSLSTPLVAGLVALMKQARLDAGLGVLTHAQAKEMLMQTAIAGTRCDEGCGAGVVNAYGAILAARGEFPPTGPGHLVVATTQLTLRNQVPTGFLVSNYGGEPITVDAAFTPDTGDLELGFPEGATFTLDPGTTRPFPVRVKDTGLPDGVHTGTLLLTPSTGSPVSLAVHVRLPPLDAPR